MGFEPTGDIIIDYEILNPNDFLDIYEHESDYSDLENKVFGGKND